MLVPELLSPAGTLRNMRYAFAYGADAVYAGLPRYSLRVRNNDFLEENLKTGIREAHSKGKKFFVAVNIMPHGSKLKTFIDDMAPIIKMNPDALIMADPGLIMLVREKWPEMTIHLSVQANVVNSAGVQFWQKAGVSRVILSRELSINEISEIRNCCPDMELEVFVHGALCIAYSGRCLLSGYFNHRDANQGSCTNSCRWDYKIAKQDFQDFNNLQIPEIALTDIKRHKRADDIYYLEDKERPGDFMPIYEDQHGTYIMNSKDLRAVEHIQRLVKIGIDCFKIEGRTKSHYYTSRTAQVYKRAIDDAVKGRDFNPDLLIDLDNLANRGYTDGFYQRHETHELQTYRQRSSDQVKSQFVAEVKSIDSVNGAAELLAKNKFRVGDKMELITPNGNQKFVLKNLSDKNNTPIDEAPGGGWVVKTKLPLQADNRSFLTRFYKQ